MVYSIGWFVDKQIVYMRHWGEVPAQEVHTVLQEFNQYAEQSDHPLVHCLIDLADVTKHPSGLEVPKILRGFKPHARSGWTLSIGEKNPLIKFVSTLVRQLSGQHRQRAYDTFEEAFDFLKQADSTIDWSKANYTLLQRQPNTVDRPD